MYRRLHIERLQLARRLGRRGLLLILIGLSWMLLGVSSILVRAERFSSPGVGQDTILQVLDGPEFSFLWVIAGALAFLVGAFHDRRVVNKHEALGWNAILTLPLLWMFFFTASYIVSLATDGQQGRPQGLYGAIVWALISIVIMIIAGWPEEQPPKSRPEE